MNECVEVRAPCRLHFGMFSFGHPDQSQFGGVGAMIEPPGVLVRIETARQFAVHGDLAERARELFEMLAVQWGLSSLPACDVGLCSPRGHTGLGVGTQLGLAVAAGIRRFLNLRELSTADLAVAAGRGARSAVGTYGFRLGGLIVDGGKRVGETIGKLVARAALPPDWRFVLICPKNELGLSGTSEATAFARLPAVPADVTQRLWSLTNEQMRPAIDRNDCRAFGKAIYEFGWLAGECFSAVQGGPYASAETERLVESIRGYGVPGVGQSSWGPTVFAVTPNNKEAEQLVGLLRRQAVTSDYEISIARPNNTGATIS